VGVAGTKVVILASSFVVQPAKYKGRPVFFVGWRPVWAFHTSLGGRKLWKEDLCG